MRVHHLNCMSYYLGYENVTHCLLIGEGDRLVLVDTGLGLGDHTNPTPFVRAFKALNRVSRDPDQTAIRQISRLGFAPQQVQDIVLTHLHIDHTGGLPDFPWARVHVYEGEYETAMNPLRFSIKERFYEAAHWEHKPYWVIHSCEGERWLGMDCARVPAAFSVEILLVPLPGHSRGHCAVAVGRQGDWLLHCGDAYVRDMQVSPDQGASAFPGWARGLEQWLFPEEPVARLRKLRHAYGDEIRMFSSHDRAMFKSLRGS